MRQRLASALVVVTAIFLLTQGTATAQTSGSQSAPAAGSPQLTPPTGGGGVPTPGAIAPSSLPGPYLTEDSGSPYTTAVGYQAAGKTTGLYDTASGYQALFSNSTGSANTAVGYQALVANTAGNNNTATGYEALLFNTGSDNTASGVDALYANNTGFANTASGFQALYSNTTGNLNTASGYAALSGNTSGANNTALGYNAGFLATTGNYNLFLGAEVEGAAADTNTIRIGLPYDGTNGQNQTFIAGIYGTALPAGGGFVPVYINAAGQLGTALPPPSTSSGPSVNPPPSIDALVQQVQELQATIANLQAQVAALLKQ